MANNFKVKDVVFAEDSYYKTQKVEIGGKNFETPIKALDLKRNIGSIQTPTTIKGLNEYYKIFNSKSIANLRTTNREHEINNEINRAFKRYSSDNEVNLCFSEFEDDKIPNKEELEYLTNLSYVHSDITPLPLLPRVAKSVTATNFDNYHNCSLKRVRR